MHGKKTWHLVQVMCHGDIVAVPFIQYAVILIINCGVATVIEMFNYLETRYIKLSSSFEAYCLDLIPVVISLHVSSLGSCSRDA